MKGQISWWVGLPPLHLHCLSTDREKSHTIFLELFWSLHQFQRLTQLMTANKKPNIASGSQMNANMHKNHHETEKFKNLAHRVEIIQLQIQHVNMDIPREITRHIIYA